MPFPSPQQIVALWVDKQEGLRATDCCDDSEASGDIKAQPWARYLLQRSGRWGQVHAQL